MTPYRKEENVIFADFRKCRDALVDGPDSPWTLVVMTIAMFGGFYMWTKLIFALSELLN